MTKTNQHYGQSKWWGQREHDLGATNGSYNGKNGGQQVVDGWDMVEDQMVLSKNQSLHSQFERMPSFSHRQGWASGLDVSNNNEASIYAPTLSLRNVLRG